MKKNLYTNSGEPKRIQCYQTKSEYPASLFSVVFTYASRAGYPNGTILCRCMDAHPLHPMGYGEWIESDRWKFHALGSRINFSELPDECKKIVMDDYNDIWEELK